MALSDTVLSFLMIEGMHIDLMCAKKAEPDIKDVHGDISAMVTDLANLIL